MTVIEEKDKKSVLPKNKVFVPKCDNKAYWMIRQMRVAMKDKKVVFIHVQNVGINGAKIKEIPSSVINT